MKISGIDFMEWLHKVRKESEKERKRKGLNGADWLRGVTKESKEIIKNYFKSGSSTVLH